ncbi:hypothetical protein BpHYR1_003560 [Brachionus plicatilis]|uniref:Uncharacterized protein n=1 Tax=Brachionus plicatilis TaxID=10195 RepID=A0A3M7QD68_BRAPC|nr:hypothetical protein BpHYR1_003560 [Brachionus plicatilis]
MSGDKNFVFTERMLPFCVNQQSSRLKVNSVEIETAQLGAYEYVVFGERSFEYGLEEGMWRYFDGDSIGRHMTERLLEQDSTAQIVNMVIS